MPPKVASGVTVRSPPRLLWNLPVTGGDPVDLSFKNAEATSTLLSVSQNLLLKWIRYNSPHMTGYRTYWWTLHI